MTDFTGWGGDLITFYAEWRKAGAPPDYCAATLFSATATTSFGLEDLIEDVDAYNIAVSVRAGDGDIAELVRQNLLEGGTASRFRRFYDSRFGGTREGVIAVAKSMLLKDIPLVLSRARKLLIFETCGCDSAWDKAQALTFGSCDACPSPEDDELLASLAGCFADALIAKVNAE
jgi:hypothetical protein